MNELKDGFDFLSMLKENNVREWFQANKAVYDRVNITFRSLFQEVYLDLNSHDKVDKMKPFRIYRDVRFSKDKSPYKLHFSCAYHREKPHLRGGYYVHLSPDESFIVCGFWQPEKEDLYRIRKEFEADISELDEIVNQKDFFKTWGEMKGDTLKVAPKGFDKHHPNIIHIRKKQFLFVKHFEEHEVMDITSLKNQISQSFILMRPFFDYMSQVLNTDLDGMSII